MLTTCQSNQYLVSCWRKSGTIIEGSQKVIRETKDEEMEWVTLWELERALRTDSSGKMNNSSSAQSNGTLETVYETILSAVSLRRENGFEKEFSHIAKQ